jgi:hypothetical protein
MKAMIASAMICATSPAFSDPSPEALAAAKEHNQSILAKSPDAEGVFIVQDDGTIKHLQSSLVCPNYFPNVELWHLEVFKSDAGKGMDVGCDYGRNEADGKWMSKLTIFAAHAPEGTTLDAAFQNYRNQVVQVTPSAVSQGEALRSGNKPADDPLPSYRSEEFVSQHDGTAETDQLYVFVADNWMYEIRVTFLGLPNRIDLKKGDTAETAQKMAGDRVMGAVSLLRTMPQRKVP